MGTLKVGYKRKNELGVMMRNSQVAVVNWSK